MHKSCLYKGRRAWGIADAFQPIPLPASQPSVLSIFAGAQLALFVLIQVGVLHYAYLRFGLGRGGALLLLLGSLIGAISTFLSLRCAISKSCQAARSRFFGMHYNVPVVAGYRNRNQYRRRDHPEPDVALFAH